MASRDSHSHRASKPAASPAELPVVSIIMGSKSDWETMSAASEMLEGVRRRMSAGWYRRIARRG